MYTQESNSEQMKPASVLAIRHYETMVSNYGYIIERRRNGIISVTQVSGGITVDGLAYDVSLVSRYFDCDEMNDKAKQDVETILSSDTEHGDTVHLNEDGFIKLIENTEGVLHNRAIKVPGIAVRYKLV